MIIWLNGGFGVGKTTIAKIIVRKLPGAQLVDPEQIGFMLRRMIPRDQRPANFQDLSLWRELTGSTITGLQKLTKLPLVVPMTLVELSYFEQITGALRDDGCHIHHFVLTATPGTLQQRLRRRWWQLPRGRNWCMEQSARHMVAFQSPNYGTLIKTDDRTASDIADEILSSLTGSD